MFIYVHYRRLVGDSWRVPVGCRTTAPLAQEVLGVHQKQMGYDYAIVRKYLSDA